VTPVTGAVAVPIHIDPALPDYVVQAQLYDTRMARHWKSGDRFRMYFGGRGGQKVGGAYYKGNIIKVHSGVAPGAAGDAAHDPWEMLEVIWDTDDGSSQHRVSGGRGNRCKLVGLQTVVAASSSCLSGCQAVVR
jgi:hypothetical protein